MVPKWEPPPLNFWDIAIDKIKGIISIRVVIRDYEDSVLASLQMKRSFVFDHLLVEATGSLQAILFSLELGFAGNNSGRRLSSGD